jgi:hypothetical protein
MAETLASPLSLPPCDTLLRRRVALTLFALLLTACGSIDYDYEFTPKNVFYSPKKDKNIGVVHFHYGDGVSQEVRFKRIKSGYAFHAPIVEESNGSYFRFTASRTKQLKYFVGFESTYTF